MPGPDSPLVEDSQLSGRALDRRDRHPILRPLTALEFVISSHRALLALVLACGRIVSALVDLLLRILGEAGGVPARRRRYRLLDEIGNDLGALPARREAWEAGDLIERPDGDLRIVRIVGALAGDDPDGYVVVQPAEVRAPAQVVVLPPRRAAEGAPPARAASTSGRPR